MFVTGQTELVPDKIKLVPMLVVMVTIFWLSHQSGGRFSSVLFHFPGLDKVAHFGIYWVLAWSTIYPFSKHHKVRHSFGICVFTVVFCLCYGLSDEFHQSFVPGRDVSFYDVVADCTGALLACICWRWWSRQGERSRSVDNDDP